MCLNANNTPCKLTTKVGWVLENSGNFLSNEQNNIDFLGKNGWENQSQCCLPLPKKCHFQALYTVDFLPSPVPK